MNYDVHGGKTNEPGCLKSHLAELFQHSPILRLFKVFIGLTNWAVSLLHVLRQRGESIKATAEEVHYAPEKTLQVLGFKKE